MQQGSFENSYFAYTSLILVPIALVAPLSRQGTKRSEKSYGDEDDTSLWRHLIILDPIPSEVQSVSFERE